MTDLAALHEAAEALARACQDADAGHVQDAKFALRRSSVAAMGAFDPDSSEMDAWQDVLGAVDDELKVGGARL